MAFTFDLLVEKMGGPHCREVCHEDLVGEAISPVKIMKASDLANVFPDTKLSTSEYIAYLPARMCRSLPVINKRGRCFTPPVLSNSAASAHGSLINVEHVIKDNGYKKDTVCGHIAGVQFNPKIRDAASLAYLPLVPKEPMPLTALMALFTRQDMVTNILEEHVSGKRTWATSMECGYFLKDCAFYYEGEFIPVPDAPADMLECLTPKSVQPYKDRRLALALGGERGQIDFWGLGLTSHPADSGSDIIALVASAGRECANDGKAKKYFPVHFDGFPGKVWKDREQLSEIANDAVDEKFHDLAAIEVIGTTQPAEDGHVHEVLSDGTIMPTNGHTHLLYNFQISRGTNPRLTGRTGEYDIWIPENSSTGQVGQRLTHFHLVDIPLKGKAKKSSDEEYPSGTVAAVADGDLASTLENDLQHLFSQQGEVMPKKFSEILARVKTLSQGNQAVKTGEVNPLAGELANILTDLQEMNFDTEVKDKVKSEIASMIDAGTLISKEDHEKAVATKAKEVQDAADKAAEEARLSAERTQARLDKVTALGVDIDFADGDKPSIRSIVSKIGFDANGEELFGSKLEAWETKVQLAKKDAEAAAAKAENVPASSTANDGKKAAPKKARTFLLGGAISDVANDAEGTPGKSGTSSATNNKKAGKAFLLK